MALPPPPPISDITIEPVEKPATPLTLTTLKLISKKTVALLLITAPLVQTVYAFREIFVILPSISLISQNISTQPIYAQLIKKAVIISTSLFVDSLYGFTLLVKPLAATRFFHIILGVVVLITSLVIFKTTALNQVITDLYYLPIT